MSKLNLGMTISMIFIAFIGYSILSLPPIEFNRKLPYFVPSLLAVYLFQAIMLCPTKSNEYQTVVSPQEFGSTARTPARNLLLVSLLLFSFGCTWVINNLLGNRTGHLLTYILKIVFFVAILFQTLLALITIRLVEIDQEINTF